MKVDRQLIVSAALDLLNEVGVDALSTRLLAERLGVKQPALYWHFKNRRALLDAMNVQILARGHTRSRPLPGEEWRAFLRENAGSFRRALLAYRDGARVHAGTEADPQDLDDVEAQVAFLVAAGFPVTRAMEILVAISRYVVGCVLEEQAEPVDGTVEDGVGPEALDAAAAAYPLLSQAIAHYRSSGYAALFESGLDLFVAGASSAISPA
jgi:TetR/AcrR family tetracycline transcriptional repressor